MSVSRQTPHYYFRRPTRIDRQYQANAVAPHALTTRSTYTVPVGRAFFMQMMECMLRLNTISAAAGARRIFIRVFAGTSHYLSARYAGNTLDGGMVAALGSAGIYFGGGVDINIVTEDLATGGDVEYYAAFGGQEFDA